MYEFEPTLRRRIEDCVNELEKLNERCKKLELKIDKQSKTLLEELNPRRLRLAEEVTRLTEELLCSIEPPELLPDETEQLYNECIGVAYGKGLFTDGNGKLLFSNGTDDLQIGDTVDVSELSPFSSLPYGEQEMLLRYLKESDETPVWFSPERYRKAETA